MKILGFRILDSELFSYTFRTEDETDICTVREFFPKRGESLVDIRSEKLDCFSTFDLESTLYPGLTRFVHRRSESREEAWRVILLDRFDFALWFEGKLINARREEGDYAFTLGDQPIGAIKNVSVQGVLSEGLYYVADVEREAFLLPILSFPMLQFAF